MRDTEVADVEMAEENTAGAPFRLVVESAHWTARSMTVVAGRWEQGTFYPGDHLELIRAGEGGENRRQVRGTHIDTFRALDRDPALGLLIGVVVEGVVPSEVRAGDILQAIADSRSQS